MTLVSVGEIEPSGWEPIDGFDTKAECVTEYERLIEKRVQRGARKLGNNGTTSAVDLGGVKTQVSTAFRCLPDSIDARRPK